ncbi:MAG TPA: VOC family protein [Kofleriaceae bacterium]|nr:VOC family protein [Kofleriaceae bacterium]
MTRITTFLTYRDGAEDAAKHYVSIFQRSKITATSRYPEGTGYTPGSVMTVSFELDGQPFIALNGGDHFKFSDAISLSIQCETQDEIEHYTNRLIEGGGEEGPCGWVRDRWGVSWQVTPTYLTQMATSSDRAVAARVMAAMMKMKRIDIRKLQEAAKG